MNPNDLQFATILVLGAISLVAVVGFTYAKVKGDRAVIDLLYPYVAISEKLVERLDTALVPCADELKPVNDVAFALQTLLRNPDSFIVQILPKPIEEAAQTAVDLIENLTDGTLEPGQEQTLAGGTKSEAVR